METPTTGEPSVGHVANCNWPLHKISEPHEHNDVLLNSPTSVNDNQWPTGDTSCGAAEDEPPIPWRSNPPNTHHDVSVPLKGNQRFFDLLLRNQEDYESRSPMEKPLVTLLVLQAWRNQNPPGRFLIVETHTNPPLWKDVGDKKARARISKALKHLTKTHRSASLITGSHPQTPQSSNACSKPPSEIRAKVNVLHKSSTVRSSSDLTSGSVDGPTRAFPLQGEEEESKLPQDSHDLIASLTNISAKQHPKIPNQIIRHSSTPDHHNNHNEEEKRASEPLRQNRAIPSQLLPPIPCRFRKPERNVRRISEQLHSAQEGGSIYGRWTERDELATIYQRQKQRRPVVDFVVISGLMGVGKTSLAQTLKNPLVDNQPSNNFGYDDDNDNGSEEELEWPFFLVGKFEHGRWSDPNAFFVSIVTDFCHQLQQRNDLGLAKQYRSAIVDSLKDDIMLLSNLVPALDAMLKNAQGIFGSCGSVDESITGSCQADQPQDDSFTCMAAQRIKEVFGKFLQSIASVFPSRHSVIVLLDDLHWASEAAMDILTSLATNKSNGGVLFVGTYRTDECEEPHFRKALLQWDHHQNVKVTKFHLKNLKEDSVHLMLADALSLKEEETQSLKSMVFSLTKGNPTFITELLRVFQDKGLLKYEEASQQWTCDLEQIPLMLGRIDGVPDLFKAKVLDLPPAIQETLKIAACLWSTEIDEAILKMIDKVGSVTSHLKLADIRGLLTYRNGRYAFVSDGVKLAIYDLIPVAERSCYHLKIGQRLWLHLEDNKNSSFFALLMTQMMSADDKITEDEDRRAVASLCLRSGRLAAQFLGFQTSWLVLSHGISIVSAQKTWGRENYDLSLSLYNTAIEVCYCNCEFKELQNLIEEVLDCATTLYWLKIGQWILTHSVNLSSSYSEVLENARTFEDSLLARSTQIYSLGSSNRQMEAIEIGLQTLKQLGEVFPMHPPGWRVYLQGRRLKSLLRQLSDTDILKLPRMNDPKKLAAMQVMNHFMLYAMNEAPNLFALLAFRMVELTIKSGLSAISSIGFVIYATILCRFDAIDEGYRYGKLALKISDSFKKAVWLCRTWAGYYGTIHGRKRSSREVIEPLRFAHRAGMRTGDIEFSCLNACLVIWNTCDIAPLPELEAELSELAGQVQFYGQSLSLRMLKPLWQFALNLMGQAEGDPKFLRGALIDGDVKLAEEEKNHAFLVWVGFFNMKAAYIFGDYDLAGQYTSNARKIYMNATGAGDCTDTMLYECLTLLALARQGKKRVGNILYVRRRLRRFRFWALNAPMNFLGNQLLLEAELAAVRGYRQKANAHYRSSILHSRDQGRMLEEALANEKLGRLYLESKDDELAVPFIKEARRIYEKWGASTKVTHFESEFGSLLRLA